MTRGTCLCGTLRYEVEDGFDAMLHCHCSMCRKHHGAPFATFASAPYSAFRWLSGEDAVVRYHSSTVTFCQRCDGKVPRVAEDRGIVVVPAGLLDTDPALRPAAHIFVRSKASWFEITDTIPQGEVG